jgi:PncC family amidohydrolase
MNIDELLQELAPRLLESGITVAAAESCTGGLISSTLTDYPGSSDYFLGGVVAYANEVKTGIVGVPAELIERHGAVSPEVARAMAEGIRDAVGADAGIAVTGIAGPGGATPGKPVGLVFIGLSSGKGDTVVREFHFKGDRRGNKQSSAAAALRMLLEHPALDR